MGLYFKEGFLLINTVDWVAISWEVMPELSRDEVEKIVYELLNNGDIEISEDKIDDLINDITSDLNGATGDVFVPKTTYEVNPKYYQAYMDVLEEIIDRYL
ncbi:MAG TPA: hypothetical protein ENF47_03045 [Thermoprotei archaeon]|nr:hypothetical protein [Thermoprotei archaeon]